MARKDAASRRLLLYAPEPLSTAFQSPHVEHRIIGQSRGRGTWWEQTHLRRAAAEDRLHAFFAPAYTAPLFIGVPLGLTIHDISFVAHPEWFRPREGFRRRWLTRHGARRAAVVFTDSDFSRAEITERLNVPSSRIQMIAPGVTNRAAPPGAPVGREAMVLYVGTIFNRRRLPDLIEAFAVAARDLERARLVIVGGDRTWPPQNLAAAAARHGVQDRVELRRYAPDDEVVTLYQRASVFAFLSEYEGFGMTPLEALSAGVPPVVLDTAVAREVYGDAAVFVRPGDIAGTAAAIRRLLVDPPSAAPVLAAAPAVLARYSWESAANRTLEHLERIARR
jgi:glycosyltransferase involved in cell wall biosynthesis